MRPLDEIDRKIIRALQENARLSNKELAAKVHLAPSSCLERARRLKDSGVLASFRTSIDPSAIGIGLQAMISVQLRGHGAENREAFREHALAREEVVALYHLTGARDFMLHVAVRDADHLRRLIVEELSARAEIESLETSVILEETRRPLPIFCGELEEPDVAAGADGSGTLEFKARMG